MQRTHKFFGGKMSVKILHIADIHLDTPFQSLAKLNQKMSQKVKLATETSLKRLIDVAIIEKVDAIVVVGDSFNSSLPNVKSQLFFKDQLDRLKQYGIRVYLCFGNHDYNPDKLLVTFGEHVFVFPELVDTAYFVSQSKERVAISGFSYFQNHISERKIDDFPEKKHSDFHIGLWHGDIVSEMQSSVYAPVTVIDLNRKRYDYWALGHIHKQQVVQQEPPILYSGNIQGLHRLETGHKGGLLITFEKGKKAIIESIDTATIIWENETIMVKQNDSLQDIQQKVKNQFKQYDPNFEYLINMNWQIEGNVPIELLKIIQDEENFDIFSTENCQIIKSILLFQQDDVKIALDAQKQALFHSFEQNGFSEEFYQSSIESLMNHKFINLTFGERLNQSEVKEEILQMALQYIKLALRGEND